jgi:hypothetical protein
MGCNQTAIQKFDIREKTLIPFNKVTSDKRFRKGHHVICSYTQKKAPRSNRRPTKEKNQPRKYLFGGRLSFATFENKDEEGIGFHP